MTRLLLTTASAIGLLALPAFAQAQTGDEIVVVANRTPEPLAKVGQTVTVLNTGDIRASQAPTIGDLLEQTPGVSLVRNGGEGQPTSVFIRGAEADQTLVLIDGVQINDQSQPAAGFDFSNLMTGDISRIEILRGAHSTLWGSQAMGGVVDIVTAPPSKALEGEISLQGGSRATQDYSAAVGGTLERLSFRLAGGYYDTNGVSAFDKAMGGREADGFHNSSFSGRLTYQLADHVQLDLRGYYTSSWNAFDGYDTSSGAFGDDAEYGKTIQYVSYAGLNFDLLGGRLQNRLDAQYTNTNRRLWDPGQAAFGAPSTETFYGLGDSARFEYQGGLDLAQGYKLVFGAVHERSTLVTDSPAYDLVPSPIKAHATLDSGYAQIQGDVLPNLTLTGGLRYDDHDTFGGHTTGQVNAAWRLNDGATVLRASFGQGFKAPALYQLFSPYGPELLHTPNLRPETANSWDLGVEHHLWGQRAVVSATYFGRDTTDLIQFVGNVAGTKFSGYTNIGHATAEGLELQAKVQPTAALTLAANYTYTDAEDATHHTSLARRPRNTANASATYVWPIGLSTTLAARYAGISHDQGFDQNFNTVPKILGSYTVVDIRAAYPITPRLEVFGRVENLFDQHYETAYQYGSLGRGGFVGLRAKF